jgi:hypothetical protein
MNAVLYSILENGVELSHMQLSLEIATIHKTILDREKSGQCDVISRSSNAMDLEWNQAELSWLDLLMTKVPSHDFYNDLCFKEKLEADAEVQQGFELYERLQDEAAERYGAVLSVYHPCNKVADPHC